MHRKKRMLATIILFFFLAMLFLSPLMGERGNLKNIEKEHNEYNFLQVVEIIPLEIPQCQNNNITESNSGIDKNTITYPNLYEDFTQEEIYMIQRCVETEAYDAPVKNKTHIASVIFNRLNSKGYKYGENVIDVITDINQFAYFRTVITESTIQAVENAYKYGDTTGGCIGFRSDAHPQYWCVSKFYTWELQFIDEIGHGFYK